MEGPRGAVPVGPDRDRVPSGSFALGGHALRLQQTCSGWRPELAVPGMGRAIGVEPEVRIPPRPWRPHPRHHEDGARGRTRTGMTARSRDFRTTSAFAAGEDAVRGLEHAFTLAPCALGARRLLSTPSAPHSPGRLGSALARTGDPGLSPNLTGATPGVSPRRAQLFKSLVSTDFTTRAWYQARAAYSIAPKPGNRGRQGHQPRPVRA